MIEKHLFSCCLIGESNLLIECAEILEKKGHKIKVIVSSDLTVKNWANKQKIINLQKPQELLEYLKTTPCDYLFSIVNQNILPLEIINLVGKAINYHDALLPSYAGINATAWAIINGEQQHGITWHEMTGEIDTGKILKQVKIPIEATDTTLTLNTKCYQAAIASFEELITQLATRQVIATSQNLNKRSYYSRHQKPSTLGIINFQSSAAKIDNLVRGLNFGKYPNTLTTAKLVLRSGIDLHYVIVTRVQKLSTKSNKPPGTIIAIQPQQLIVATNSEDLAVQTISDKLGETISIEQLAVEYQLKAGQQLPNITPETANEIVNLANKLAPKEKYWYKQLTQWQSLTLPGIKKPAPTKIAKYQQAELPISQKVINFIEQTYGVERKSEVIIALFAVYLARLSGNQELSIGLEGYLNKTDNDPYFASCVPVNININPQQHLTSIVEAIAQKIKDHQHHTTYTTDIVARYPQLAINPPEFTVTITDNIETVSGDLTLGIFASHYIWLYNDARFSKVQITTMIEQWKSLTEAIADNPDTPCQHPLISLEETKRILAWNKTEQDYPQHLCIHQLFEARVVEDSEAIAVICQEKSLTRGELNTKANQLAHHLQKLGIGAESLVGVSLERSVEMAIAIFAVLKAGGAYVPLDPNYPAARLNYLLEDAQVSVLLTQTKLLEQLPATTAKIICLDQNWQTTEEDTNPISSVNSHNLAYVIYTSGSTGNPKGVAIEHHSAVNTLYDMEQRFKVTEQDRVLAVSSLSFDLSVYDLFGVLGSGGTAILPQPATCPEPEHWLELITKKQITIWNSAPALLELLINDLIAYKKQLPSSLRLILLSGDRINPNLITQLQNLNPKLQIISLGGATEASIWSIYYPIPENWTAGKTIPYGRPLTNQSFYILDPQAKLVPIGVTGELYIGGVGVAREYLHRPELNACKFIADPFSSLPTARLYKTGDLGRYLEDGNIEFLGRIDNQVKINGVRIELGEIEATLLQCPDIQETVVTVNSYNTQGLSLVAYSILKPNSKITSQQLRNLLKTKLPDSVIPASFIFLDSFPLTPNGKVDLKALSQTPPQHLTKQQDRKLLENPLEVQLSKIWSQVLNTRAIARDDNFFDLGGNSLLALRLFEKIHATLGVKLPLATLFTAPTIAQLASLMVDQGWSAPWSSLVSIKPQGSKPPFFCIHPVNGNILCYRPLAAAFGKDYPFYGLQARGLDGTPRTATSLEEIANDYIQEIQLVQPHGPYFLGGYSFGGFVAYEMARQLEQQGEKVGLVALIDCLGPNYIDKSTFPQRMQLHLYNLSQLSPVRAYFYFLNKIDYLFKQKIFRSIIEKLSQLNQRLFPKKASSPKRLDNYQLMLKYIPKAYGQKITLLRAQVRDVKGYHDPYGGWGGLAEEGVDVHIVPGDHTTILLEPKIAEILTQKIDDALNSVEKTDNYPSRQCIS
ncbi:amino acid adenylation domain protein [Chondrocystis sp. NIES-4102]|nr:amino acid adenylation domain protein [Chondrocystis sp. NIES-4102]